MKSVHMLTNCHYRLHQLASFQLVIKKSAR